MASEILCESCMHELPPSDPQKEAGGVPRIHAPFDYSHPPLRKALWALKFKGDIEVARVAAALLHDHLMPLLEEYTLYKHVKNPLLIPIPISRARRWARGYNQAEEIAKALSQIDGERSFELACKVLHKTKNTLPQTSLRERSERLKNIKGCFAVKDATHIRNRDIILLDDIYTTGSTLKEARRVLKDAGARTVICVAVAH